MLALECSLAYPALAGSVWTSYGAAFGLTAVTLGVGAGIAGYRSARQGKGFWNGFAEHVHNNWSQEVAITSAIFIVSLGISTAKFAIENAVSKKALEKAASLNPTETVGRWMSRAEYEEMLRTGYVQEPLNGSGVSYVSRPADINAFMKHATSGSVYVEFEVPVCSLRNTQIGWAKIIGPNSIDARLMVKQGLLPPLSMPKAINIKLIQVK